MRIAATEGGQGMTIRIKRVYEAPAPADGLRVLVDRLWPRGVAKEAARIDHWLKEVAPSDELRRWFGHDPERWEGFRERYVEELDRNVEAVALLREWARGGTLTLVYGARDEEHNQAVALRDFLVSRGSGQKGAGRPAP